LRRHFDERLAPLATQSRPGRKQLAPPPFVEIRPARSKASPRSARTDGKVDEVTLFVFPYRSLSLKGAEDNKLYEY
jgi:hypothetical protein